MDKDFDLPQWLKELDNEGHDGEKIDIIIKHFGKDYLVKLIKKDMRRSFKAMIKSILKR